MGRKRSTATAISMETGEITEPADSSAPFKIPPATPVPPKPAKTSLAARRLSIELNDDGSVAWNSMRETNVVEFRNLLNRPEIKEEFKDKSAPLFSAESCYGFYDLLGKLMAFAASKWKDVPTDIATEAFSFNDADKKLLGEPTVKVFNKYAPLWAVKYQDEITLGFTFLTVVNAKIMLARALTESRAANPVVDLPKPVVPMPKDVA